MLTMKHILLFEAYTTLDQDLTQRVEFKDKMLKDYKQYAGAITTAYLSDKDDSDTIATNIINKTAVKSGTNVIKNTYLLKLIQLQKDDKRVRQLENNIKDEESKTSDIKSNTDKSQTTQIAQQLTQNQTNIKDTTTELNALKSKIAKDYADFDKDMKDALKDIKDEVADLAKNK